MSRSVTFALCGVLYTRSRTCSEVLLGVYTAISCYSMAAWVAAAMEEIAVYIGVRKSAGPRAGQRLQLTLNTIQSVKRSYMRYTESQTPLYTLQYRL